MSEFLTPIVYQVGVGGILGFLAGYALRKILKILAVILGLFALGLIYLGYVGVINVNYDKLSNLIEEIIHEISGASSLFSAIITNLPFASSFVLSMAFGFKKG